MTEDITTTDGRRQSGVATADDDDPDECPVCGQPFDNRYETSKYDFKHRHVRSDGAVCQKPLIGSRIAVYVHVLDG